MSANIETMFRQCSVNLVATLLPNIKTMFRQSCVNVAWQHWSQYWELMLGQHSGNAVLILSKRWCHMLGLTLRKCYGNVVWMLLQCHSQHWGLTLRQCPSSVSLNVVSTLVLNIVLECLGPEWDLHSNLNLHTFATSSCIFTPAQSHLQTRMNNIMHHDIWFNVQTIKSQEISQLIYSALSKYKLSMSETHSSTVFQLATL